MDEFNKLPEEFTVFQDEFNEHQNSIQTRKAKKHKEKNIMKYLCASSAVLLTFPTYFGILNVPEVKEEPVIVENNDVIIQNNNNNNEIIIDTNGNNTASDKEPVNNEGIKVETIKIRVDCEKCEGTGIICPGDPNFGYDRGNGYGYEGCHGTGYSPCPDIWCQGDIKICQNCQGSGSYDGETCEDCHGSGTVDCEFCNNTGIAGCICEGSHSHCDKCMGNGYYFEERVIE